MEGLKDGGEGVAGAIEVESTGFLISVTMEETWESIEFLGETSSS